MKKGLNQWSVMGNVGGDPEVNYTKTGTAVANFSVGVNSAWKDQDGELKEHVEWVAVVAWKKLAEVVAQYVKKGDAIYVSGRAQTRSWEDKEAGIKRYKTELIADNLIMLGSKRGAPDRDEPGVDSPPLRDEKKQDDLPF